MKQTREQIVRLFTYYGKQNFGLWFSGIRNEGEFISINTNGRIYTHRIYKDGKMIKDLLEQ